MNSLKTGCGTIMAMIALVQVVLLSAAYPRFGFVVRRTKWNMSQDGDRLVELFAAAGFKLKSQGEGKMVFAATNILDRLVMLFEDEIEVEQQGEEIVISGIRRGVAKVIYRIN